MKRTVITAFATAILIAHTAFAADFSPTQLKLVVDPVIGYDFDGSRLEIPVLVEGTNAGLIFSLFTKDYAELIDRSVSGYLGWHYVNKVDTCVYYTPLKSVAVGENVITWDGRDQDGAYVPAGEYTYYVWGFDNQGAKQLMTQHMHSGWGFDITSAIMEHDENGLPLANPIWYRAGERWLIGNDPTDETLKEVTTIELSDGWSVRGEPCMDPDDFNYFYLNIGSSEIKHASIIRLKWVPGGVAELQTDWGEDGFAEIYSTAGGGSPGVVTDGPYLYTGDENHVASLDPDADFYIYDRDGYMVEAIDLSPWWSSAVDLEAGGQMNGGPNNFFERHGYVFLNCHCNCLNQMIDPQRYLDSGDYDDLFVWSNGNGDYVLDHNFEETAQLPWICNDYNVGPYKYSISADNNLFSAANAYDVGAVSFGLLAPDGTGLGYFAFAGETAGWKKGTVFIDGDTPFDGIYCDNYKTDWGRYKQAGTSAVAEDTGIHFIGHDSVKGVITTGGPRPDIEPYVTLTAPNGGEEIDRGTVYAISWRFYRVERIAIEFSSDGGGTWENVAENIDATARSYSWTVPNAISDACYIRISDTDNPETSDTNDYPFSIVRPPLSQYYFSEIEDTGNNATLLVTAANPPALFGEPLEYGDCIGVFTPRGVCAGAAIWLEENVAITLWGDDSLVDGTRGFLDGDALTFKIWDESERREYLVEGTYQTGDGIYRTDGIYVLGSLDVATAEAVLSLAGGWNTVSLPLLTAESTMEAILGPVADDLVLAKNGRGQIYWPEYGIDAIGEWRMTDGYQLYMSGGTDLTVSGYGIFAPDIEYALPENWSLISYIGPEGLELEEAFGTIADKVIAVKNGAGEVWWPEYEVDQIAGMCHGEGYWVYLSGPATFSFPASGESSPAAKRASLRPAGYFTSIVNTGNNATVMVPSAINPAIDGRPLTSGDEIAVFTSTGLCIGAGVWREGGNLAIAVWGDNGMTDETDGAVQGEMFTFSVWDNETGEVIDAYSQSSSGTITYSANALIVLDILAAGEHSVDAGSESPAAFSLGTNRPNPFNPSTSIPFTIGAETRVALTVYDVTGAKVATLTDGVLPAGRHEAVWNAAGFPSGVYFYRLKAGAFEDTGKMMLVK